MLHSGSDVTRVEGGEEDPGRCVKAVMKEGRQVRRRQERCASVLAGGAESKAEGETGRETRREGEIPTIPMEPVSSGSSGTEEEGTLGPGDTTKWVRLTHTSAHHLGSYILKPNHHWELFPGLPRSPEFLLEHSLGTCF